MADCLVNEYQIAPEKIQVIHNFSRAVVAHSEEKQPIILAAGRLWDRAKNLVLLDRIAPELVWEVRVAGSMNGPAESGIAAKRLHRLGSLPHPELLRTMSAAGTFAHPALYEPFGLAVLEAAHARCALALSDIPSLRELWDGAAVFIDPRDEGAWLTELNTLSGSSERRNVLGQAAASRALRYSAEKSVNSYLSLYRKMFNPEARKEVAA